MGNLLEMESKRKSAEAGTRALLFAGLGCALVITGAGIAAALVLWAAQGFPGLE